MRTSVCIWSLAILLILISSSSAAVLTASFKVYGDIGVIRSTIVPAGVDYTQEFTLPTDLGNLSLRIYIENLEDHTISYNLSVNGVIIASNQPLSQSAVNSFTETDLINAGIPSTTTRIIYTVNASGTIEVREEISADDKPMVAVGVSVKEYPLSKPLVRVDYSHPYAVRDVVEIDNPSDFPVLDARLVVDYPPSAFNKPVDELPLGTIDEKSSKTSELRFQKKGPEIVAREEREERVGSVVERELRLKVYSYEDVTARFEIEKRYLKGIEKAEKVSVEVNSRKVAFKEEGEFIKFEAGVREKMNLVVVHYAIPTISVVPPAPAKVIEEERGLKLEDIIEYIMKFFDWLTRVFKPSFLGN